MSTALATKAEVLEPGTQLAPAPFSPEHLIAKAIDKGLTLDMLERLLEMRRQLQAEQDAVRERQAKVAFDQSLAEFQRECPVIAKRKCVYNKDGKSVRYRYAPLGDIVEQVKDLLGKHGFAHKIGEAFLDRDTKEIVAVCTITHRGGHAEETERRFPLAMSDFMSPAQSFASAYTFASRYAFCGALGILTGDEDDDANSLDTPEPKPKQEPPRHQTPPATAPKQNGHAEAPARQLPRDGLELCQRLKALEDGLVKEKKCKPAALFTHVREAGMNQGYSDDLARWNEPEQIAFAVDAVKAFLNAPQTGPATPAPDGLKLHNWCRQRGKELHAQAGCTNEDDLLKWMAAHGKVKGWGEDITKWRGQQLVDGEVEAERWLSEQWERVRAQGEQVEGVEGEVVAGVI